MLGNIQFIGELYKNEMLKENVMKGCVETLLNVQRELDSSNKLKHLRFNGAEVDEMNLEVTAPGWYFVRFLNILLLERVVLG